MVDEAESTELAAYVAEMRSPIRDCATLLTRITGLLHPEFGMPAGESEVHLDAVEIIQEYLQHKNLAEPH
ncbi:hypothetical protein [Azospirillum canadense]|uniref:hypothetical protein n=1 Tax=Azospirillum canadense TaxID=403962 RepID=UPI0022279E4B|nr:hypothetical protein [Azospirillum canadense]MCW2242318.1 hypothetical protein [Azospirillum canadense]